MKLAWLTDIHLNLLTEPQLNTFFSQLAQCPADALLISGDIAVGPNVAKLLLRLVARIQRPTYFVLGNHDFWESSFVQTRERAAKLQTHTPELLWLGNSKAVALSKQVGLLGHDGWYDGRLGDYEGSDVRLNDFTRIQEYALLSKSARLELMQAQAGDRRRPPSKHAPSSAGAFRDADRADPRPAVCAGVPVPRGGQRR